MARIALIYILITFLFLGNSYAMPGGIVLSFGDMAQGAPKYILPHFRDEDEAIEFSLRRKWIEPFLQQMKEHRTVLYDQAYHRTNGWMLSGQRQKGNIYWEQWHYVDLSIRIMENFKKKGTAGRGDPAMIIYIIPPFDSFSNAVKFGHDNKYIPALYESMLEHIKYLRIHAAAKHYSNPIANHNYQLRYKTQLAYSSACLHVMDFYKQRGITGYTGDDDSAMATPVGSSFYAGVSILIKR